MMNKKILLFIDSLVGGGAQRQLVAIARCFKDRGYDVSVLTYRQEEQLKSFLDEKNIPHYVVEKKYKLDLVFFFRLVCFFRRHQPDCVISYLNTPNLWVRLVRKPARIKRVITSERNIDIDKSAIRILLEKVLHPLSDKIVVNAYAIKDLLVKNHIPSEKIVVIYNGLDTEYFQKKNPFETQQFRKDLGFGADEFIITLPGRIMPQKNHVGLIKAIADVEALPEKVKCLFVGNEFCIKTKNIIESEIKKTGLQKIIIFAGVQSDMPLVYSASNLIVLPSLWEGLPNVVIESMSCGTPVVVTDVSDNSLIVTSNVEGFVVRQDSISDLSAALTMCFKMNESALLQLGINGRKKVLSQFSIDRCVDEYESLVN